MGIFEAARRATYQGASLIDALAYLAGDLKFDAYERNEAQALVAVRDNRRTKLQQEVEEALERHRAQKFKAESNRRRQLEQAADALLGRVVRPQRGARK